MLITSVETIRSKRYPNVLWVEVGTDEGVRGLGETFFGAAAVEAYLHETVAPQILGRDPLAIEKHWTTLYGGYIGYGGAGAEMRGNSAVDVALWDVFGQISEQPLYQLLGGRVHERLRAYNTCAGYQYIRQDPVQSVSNWGVPSERSGESGPYEDLDGFLHRPGELAHSLVEEGFTAMKIWPFDIFAERSCGHYISNEDLDKGLEPFAEIRAAVGTRLDIMVEFHGLWDLPMARRIGAALEPYGPFWYEDPLRSDNLEALARMAASTVVPITLSETIFGRWRFKEVLDSGAAGIVMLDVGWVGGVSEAKKVAAMADANKLPVAPHDCTGPVVLTASTHIGVSTPNTFVQEVVRSFYHGWYQEVVTDLPGLVGGYIQPPPGPGLGTRLQPDFKQRAGSRVLRSDWDG